MEYAIGSVVTLVTLLIFSRLFKMAPKDIKSIKLVHTQSRVFEVVKPAIPYMDIEKEPPVTQAFTYEQSIHLRVIVSNGVAYWIHDNRLYQGDFVDGEIDKESGKLVDTMALNKVELDRMSFIVDRLNSRGGSFDYRNTGNEEF